MANKGYFVLTDISGYTEFLTESELEHAHQALQNLFDAQLQHIKFPLKISGFRGDAILIYTPEASIINPQSFVEMLETLYIVFADALVQMQLNTTCPCRACQNIKNLDLKMCIHYGEYIIQKLGDREELLGTDVIVPHRMLKNHVTEQTNIRSYALFSEAAARALGLQDLCDPLVSYRETYEHLGEVNMLVHNLRTAWEREQMRKNFTVEPDNAWIKIEVDIPFPPSVVWGVITTPQLEAPLLGLESVKRVDELGGRTRPEAKFHCAHSSGDFFNTVVEWKPFEYYTTLQQFATGLEYYRTIRLDYNGAITHFRMLVSKPEQQTPEGFREFLESAAREGYERLPTAIQDLVDSGKIKVE